MNALARLAGPVANSFTADPLTLRIFGEVPDSCDVVPLRGLVAVYDTDWRFVRDGGLYVVERQTPVGGMSWETYDRFNREHGPREPRCRIKTSREVVQVRRRPGDSDPSWWLVLPSGFHDGPIADWALGHNFVGEVLGLYRPASVGA